MGQVHLLVIEDGADGGVVGHDVQRHPVISLLESEGESGPLAAATAQGTAIEASGEGGRLAVALL